MPSRPKPQIPELLAPAGGRKALVAAVNNGADAVYLGLRSFNARRGAENFDLEGLSWACDFAHLRGAKVYLTANVLVLPDEAPDALATVADAWAAGVDAVIVQDVGLARIIREQLPHVRLHASTQIDAHDSATVRQLERLGFSRVTLARETPLARIAAIAHSSTVEVETFVHGALCFSYSGQCLLSSAVGGRSANRGMCAQPCRLPYDLLIDGVQAKTPGKHLLSPKDLAAIERLPDLVRAGVSALKIEGRAKAPEYVAIVTAAYRAALDRFAEDPERWAVLPSELSMLEEAFSRGFTDAYLDGRSGNDMMSYTRPNNRGVPIGRVVEAAGGFATVVLDRDLHADDTIEFWTARGRHAQRVGRIFAGPNAVQAAAAGQRVRIAVEAPVAEGDRVFRVSNAALAAAARRTFEPASAVDLRAAEVQVLVGLRIGEPARITVRLGEHEASAEGSVVEPARTRAVTVEDVVEHVGRMGGSGYRAGSWSIDLDPGAGIGFSVLHRLRREALAALDEARLRPWRDRVQAHPAVPHLQPVGRPAGPPELVAVVWSAEQAQRALEAGADAVFVRVTRPDDLATLPAGTWPAFPRVTPQDDVPGAWLADGVPERSMAATLGLLAALADAGCRVEADWPLNAVNPWSVAALADLGAARVWLSPELPGALLATTARRAPAQTGVLVAGRLELMVAEHCVIQAAGRCGSSCDACPTRRRAVVLKDRKGYEFPLVVDSGGRTHLYNAVPLDLSRVIGEIVESGASAVRFDASVEQGDEVRRVVSALRAVVDGSDRVPPLFAQATTGHYYRRIT
ncbi:MAG: DUF3656 domain-containing protein [Anaerosomatales bacterium]|nr:DUF3656 domain-containing protein [Anaerosomatales bacterium]